MKLGFKSRLYDLGGCLEALTLLPQHVSVPLKIDSFYSLSLAT